jgi:hypothetical protein
MFDEEAVAIVSVVERYTLRYHEKQEICRRGSTQFGTSSSTQRGTGRSQNTLNTLFNVCVWVLLFVQEAHTGHFLFRLTGPNNEQQRYDDPHVKWRNNDDTVLTDDASEHRGFNTSNSQYVVQCFTPRTSSAEFGFKWLVVN